MDGRGTQEVVCMLGRDFNHTTGIGKAFAGLLHGGAPQKLNSKPSAFRILISGSCSSESRSAPAWDLGFRGVGFGMKGLRIWWFRMQPS